MLDNLDESAISFNDHRGGESSYLDLEPADFGQGMSHSQTYRIHTNPHINVEPHSGPEAPMVS